MTNTQTAALAAAVLLGALIVGAAITKPWQALRPEPANCIVGGQMSQLDLIELAQRTGCKLP